MNKKEELKNSEVPSAEKQNVVKQDAEPTKEVREFSPDEQRSIDQIRQELDLMELDSEAKNEVSKKAQKIEFLGEKEKINHLLEIAREKGVVFAVGVARKMNEPYLLDLFHDILAKEGFFKDFSK